MQENACGKELCYSSAQVALVPRQRAIHSSAFFEIIKEKIRNSLFSPLERSNTIEQDEKQRHILVKPYYFCPLCHHQFSYSHMQDSYKHHFMYPQPSYFRTLGGKAATEKDEANFSYYSSYFIEIRKLSRGSFGAVYVCQHILNNVALGIFAVKKIPVGNDKKYLSKVLKEVRILEEMKKHPNVIEYNHSWIDTAKTVDFGPETRCLFILMEFATEGSLDEYLRRQGNGLSTMLIWYFFLSAIAGVNHLHLHNVLHCDLKPQNLLLSSCHDGTLPRLMVSDFGASCGISDFGDGGCTGTEEYMAPELFTEVGSPTRAYRCTKHSDMWSLGVILHFLMCRGALPHFDRTTGKMCFHRLVYTQPKEMIFVLQQLLSDSPTDRPSCQDILESDTVQKLRHEVMNNRSFFEGDCHGQPHFEFMNTEVSKSAENLKSPLPSPLLKPQLGYSSNPFGSIDALPGKKKRDRVSVAKFFMSIFDSILNAAATQVHITLGMIVAILTAPILCLLVHFYFW